MKNYSNFKRLKYKDQIYFHNRENKNPFLTENSEEKNLENNINISYSKNLSYFKYVNMNKTSKSSQSSDKYLINIKTLNSKSKENSKNRSNNYINKMKKTNSIIINNLFKSSFPNIVKSTLSNMIF